LLLKFYPREYRKEYGEELQTVFNLSLGGAAAKGGFAIGKLVLRELISLPKAILIEHLRERSKAHMVPKFAAYFHFTYGSRREFFTALYPFFLLGVILPIVNILGQSRVLPVPNLLFNWIAVVLLGLLGLLFLSGLVTGLPRWSLPYVGFLFSLLSVYGLGDWLNHGNLIPFMALYHRSWLLGQIAYQGSLWVGLTVIALVLVLLFGFIPALRRFRNDWTLLVFLLYGAIPFALLFTFDDYVHEELYELLAFVILIAGIWFYLRTENLRRRFWTLFGGMTFALFLAAVAKGIIFSSLSWPYPRLAFEWQNEMMSTVIMWMWIALSMLVPLVLELLPGSDPPSSAA
jgi:hypothetical protein